MKKLLFFTVSILILTQVEAQKMYVNLYGGYSVPTTREAFASTNFQQIQYGTAGSSVQRVSDELIATTLGAGLQYGGAFGYQLTEHLALELGAHYLNGSPQTAKGEVRIDYGDPSPTRQSRVDVTIRRQTKQMRLTPSVVIRGGGMFKILYPYAKFGLIAPVGGKTQSEITRHFTHPDTVVLLSGLTNDSTVYSRFETKGKPTLGLQSALGLQFKLGIIGAYIEVAHQALSVRPDRTKLVAHTRHGKDAMDLMTPYDKETIYLDKMTAENNNIIYNPNAFADPDITNNNPYEGAGYQKSKEDLRLVGQYSNIGVNIGVQVRF